MVLRPEKEAEAEAIFRKWGLDFAIVGQHDRRSPLPRPPPAARSRPTCRSRSSATRRREYDRPYVERKAPPPLDPRSIPQSTDCGDDLIRILNSRRHELAPLGLGAIRPPDRRQHRRSGPAATRRVVRVGGQEGPRLLPRRDAALLRRRPVRGRQAGGGRMLAQPHRGRRRAAGRHRQPQFRQSRRSPRSWASWSAPSKASARPAPPSPSRSSPATSRSTTRPTASRSRRRRRSAASGCSPTSTMSRRIAFKARGRGDPAGRRAAGLGHASRPVDLAPRDRRPRGRPAAAGRPRPREARRRFRARPDPRRPRHRRPRSFRRRPCRGARRDGDGVRHRRHASTRLPTPRRPRRSSARIRAATW